jgi:hypothetical protein
MQTAAANSMTSAAANESALQAQIAAMRESLNNHRTRARNLWDACSPEAAESSGEARIALGQFTAKFLKGQTDAVYG